MTPDSMYPSTQVSLTDITPAQPAPVPSTAPTPRKSQPHGALQASKRAAGRLNKLLAGAKKWKQDAFLKGPLSFSTLTALGADFADACTAADQSLVGRKNAGADATALLLHADGIVAAVQDYADVFYAYGTTGRSLFYAVGGKASTADELDACIRGVEADRTAGKDAAGKVVPAPHLIPVVPETDLPMLKKLVTQVRAGLAAATLETDGRTAMTTRRDALGQQIRRATPLVEKLVRRLNKETPARLADFGVKPR